MRLEIRRRGVAVTEELRTCIQERLRLALARFGRHVGPVRVYLRDVNGPRGGLDRECRVVVELPARGRVVVAGVDADVRAAVAAVANRAGLAVKRRVQRRRERRARRRPARGLMAAGPYRGLSLEAHDRSTTGFLHGACGHLESAKPGCGASRAVGTK